MKSSLSGLAIAATMLVGTAASHAQDIKLGVIAGMSGPGTS